ncbi:MAG: hypothetical protein K9N62_19385 [Verrucomicrobia bacterium]|nr:hypothetical protein [Verrucomicrobiota bacterium]
MITDLDELIQHLKRTLPQPKSILQIKPSEEGKYVTFVWNGRTFLVRQNLQVFEVKGTKVFITGASSLMQSALVVKNYHQKTIEGMMETLGEVEGMVGSVYQRERGMQMLETVKKTIAKMAGIDIKKAQAKQASLTAVAH